VANIQKTDKKIHMQQPKQWNNLIELGYIERPSENVEKAIKNTVNENNYYLSRSCILMVENITKPLRYLKKLFEENPTSYTLFGMRLAHAYQSINKVAGNA
jgi:hypothetical protein